MITGHGSLHYRSFGRGSVMEPRVSTSGMQECERTERLVVGEKFFEGYVVLLAGFCVFVELLQVLALGLG